VTPKEKWAFLHDAPAHDARHHSIKTLAGHLRAAAGNVPARFATLAQSVARDWIKQVIDTERVGREDIAGLTRKPTPDDAVDALRRGRDDCDAKARLFVALCLAAGVPARMVGWWNHDTVPDLVHVSAEVQLHGKWEPVELTLARARLGELGTNVPGEKKDGKWKVS
jgi:transglutaminase-like putative cysteine protease